MDKHADPIEKDIKRKEEDCQSFIHWDCWDSPSKDYRAGESPLQEQYLAFLIDSGLNSLCHLLHLIKFPFPKWLGVD